MLPTVATLTDAARSRRRPSPARIAVSLACFVTFLLATAAARVQVLGHNADASLSHQTLGRRAVSASLQGYNTFSDAPNVTPCVPVPPNLSPKHACAHIQKHCTQDDDKVLARYLSWYYCVDADQSHKGEPSSTHVRSQRMLRLLVLLGFLAFMFSFVGIAASDFFCPNLSTLASRLGMSDSTAGVTLLSIGNSSPDVFSTYSAMRSDSGALAIGELIGAASFITSVVAGSVMLIADFNVRPYPFVRDVAFFAVAVAVVLFCLFDGELHLKESLSMIGLYLLYAAVVIIGSWLEARRGKGPIALPGDDVSSYSVAEQQAAPSLRIAIPTGEEQSGAREAPGTAAESSSLPTPLDPHAHHLRPGYIPRHSILGAIEFRDVLSNLRKEASGDMSVELFQSRDPESFLRPLNSTSMMFRSLSSRSPSSSTGKSAMTTPITAPAVVQNGLQPGSADLERRDTKDWQATADYFGAQGDDSGSSALSITENHWADAARTVQPASKAAIQADPGERSSVQRIRRDPKRIVLKHELIGVLKTLFPSLQNLWAKSWLGIFVSFAAAPAILCLNLTLPVVDDELEAKIASVENQEQFLSVSLALPGEDRQLLAHTSNAHAQSGNEHGPASSAASAGDSDVPVEALIELSRARKMLTVIQCALAPPFCVWAISDAENPRVAAHCAVATVAGAAVGLTSLFIIWHTRRKRPPAHFSTIGALARCMIGFVVAIMWIMTIVDQVVVILQALGSIAGVSEASELEQPALQDTHLLIYSP